MEHLVPGAPWEGWLSSAAGTIAIAFCLAEPISALWSFRRESLGDGEPLERCQAWFTRSQARPLHYEFQPSSPSLWPFQSKFYPLPPCHVPVPRHPLCLEILVGSRKWAVILHPLFFFGGGGGGCSSRTCQGEQKKVRSNDLALHIWPWSEKMGP